MDKGWSARLGGGRAQEVFSLCASGPSYLWTGRGDFQSLDRTHICSISWGSPVPSSSSFLKSQKTSTSLFCFKDFLLILISIKVTHPNKGWLWSGPPQIGTSVFYPLAESMEAPSLSLTVRNPRPLRPTLSSGNQAGRSSVSHPGPQQCPFSLTDPSSTYIARVPQPTQKSSAQRSTRKAPSPSICTSSSHFFILRVESHLSNVDC